MSIPDDIDSREPNSVNNEKTGGIENRSSSNNRKSNSDNNTITIKRSTFTKIMVVGVAALMIAAFLAGYNLRGGISETNTQALLTSAIQALQNQPPPAAVVQQPAAPGALPSQQPFPAAAPPSVNVSSIPIVGQPVMGAEDAPLTLVEYSDFQCPFCQSFFSDVLPQIQNEYVDTGKIKFVYKHFPMEGLHPNAQPAAIASECANEQGKFWEYHDILFENQTLWQSQTGNQTVQSFKQFATDLGLDPTKFNSCIDTQKYRDEVTNETQEATTFSVSGTPTFYLGNEETGYTQFVGAQPFASFKTTIDQKLQQQRNNSTVNANGSAPV